MARERCAFCGALNPANAEWCGQCLRQFPPPEAETAAEKRSAAPGSSSGSSAAADGATRRVESREGAASTQGVFTVTEAGITWTCEQCETSNPLEAQYCSVCGATFADMVRPKDPRRDGDPNTAALISLFLPGAGHMYLGLWPQGIARAIVSIWVVSVVMISLIAGRGQNTTALSVTFGLAATALWLIGAHDAYREARREASQTILKGKVFLYSVLGLLTLLFILLVSAGFSARA